MGINLRRALAAMLPTLVCLSSTALADGYFTAPTPAGQSNVDPYYAQNDSDHYLTGADETKSQPAAAAQSIGNCNWCGGCSNCLGDWRDNTLFWFGADGYKSLGDFTPPAGVSQGFMNSAGVVGGFNTGFRLGQSRIRGQVGASYGIYDLKGRDTASASSSEQQTFITAGFYKRSDVCDGDRISWGVVYDQFFGHQWGLFASEVYLSQFRGILGYAISEYNEVGVWGTAHTNNDGSVGGQPTPIRDEPGQRILATQLRTRGADDVLCRRRRSGGHRQLAGRSDRPGAVERLYGALHQRHLRVPQLEDRTGRFQRIGVEYRCRLVVLSWRQGGQPDRLWSARLAVAACGQQWLALDYELEPTERSS